MSCAGDVEGQGKEGSRVPLEHWSMVQDVFWRALRAQLCWIKAWRQPSPRRLALGRALTGIPEADQSPVSPGCSPCSSQASCKEHLQRHCWCSHECLAEVVPVFHLPLLLWVYSQYPLAKCRLLQGWGMLWRVEPWTGSDDIEVLSQPVHLNSLCLPSLSVTEQSDTSFVCVLQHNSCKLERLYHYFPNTEIWVCSVLLFRTASTQMVGNSSQPRVSNSNASLLFQLQTGTFFAVWICLILVPAIGYWYGFVC